MANVNPFFGGGITDMRPPVTMADGAHPMNASANAVVDDIAISRNAAAILAVAIGVVFALHFAGFKASVSVQA